MLMILMFLLKAKHKDLKSNRLSRESKFVRHLKCGLQDGKITYGHRCLVKYGA